MSLKLNERYPGRFNNPSDDYPQGSFKNRTTPTSKDGSYLEKDWANDKEAFFQSLLEQAGVSPNGLVDRVGASQYYDALVEIISAMAPTPVQATESAAGVAKVATQALTNAGVDDATIVTPKKLFSGILSALGFTPVQQGGGIGQSTNKVHIGWSNTGKLKVTVDETDLGNVAFNLDSVNNTSDVDKPVSAAQQAALNLKMNLTGDGAVPRLGAVSVNSSGLAPNQQGAYLFWNETGYGRTSLVNNQGDGTGGFIFRNVNKSNTVETGRVAIDGSGSLSTTGTITAAGNIYGANGAVTLQDDGNVYGSVWGGWLNNYIANSVANAIATTLGYNQTWQDVTANRALATTYTNTTGRPIYVSVMYKDNATNVGASFSIGSLSTTTPDMPNNQHGWFSAVIPNGETYKISGGLTVSAWWELR